MFANKNELKVADIQISINGHKVDEADHTKFFGVMLDSKMNKKKHISYITGKLAKGIDDITKARKLLD